MINHLSLAKKSWMVDCFCFLVNIFSIFVKYLNKISSTLSYVSNIRRTVSSASKPSAFVGTSFSTGSSSLSEFSPSVSLFNREFTISSSDLVSVTTTVHCCQQQQLPPMWPRFHLVYYECLRVAIREARHRHYQTHYHRYLSVRF